jgi:hypothetical protein
VDRHSCKTNFGMDCLQKGILPVYLRASNGNKETTFRIVASNIWFGLGENSALQVRSGIRQTNTSAAGSNLAVAGAAAGGILVMGLGMKLTDDEESIRENFVIKQFQNVNLAPGKSAEGFVYFVQPHAISLDSLPVVNVSIQNLQSEVTNTISIPLGATP